MVTQNHFHLNIKFFFGTILNIKISSHHAGILEMKSTRVIQRTEETSGFQKYAGQYVPGKVNEEESQRKLITPKLNSESNRLITLLGVNNSSLRYW